jgi:hypothetical protein
MSQKPSITKPISDLRRRMLEDNLLRTIESPLDWLTLPEFSVKREPEPAE